MPAKKDWHNFFSAGKPFSVLLSFLPTSKFSSRFFCKYVSLASQILRITRENSGFLVH